MPSRHAVISGASIAGLSTAFWLRRTGWEVTVLERAPAFRDGGQNVDVRGVAKRVLDRMDLVEAVKAQNTTETGTVIVDAKGAVTATLPTDGDGATAELEILRGDFARTILDHLPPGVEFIWNDTVARIEEDPDAATVTTAAGRTLNAGLVVIAEGVRSSTRDMLFGDLVDRKELQVTMVFGTIPRTADDDDTWRWHNATAGRQIHLRPDNHGTTRAILAYSPSDDVVDLDRPQLLAHLRTRYADAGWQAPRILDAFETSDDVYVDQLTQIRMPTWHRGRVVLTGDAAWCVTPMGGGGASLALTGGYVLAAYLATNPADNSVDLDTALDDYQAWMRPLVDDVQHLMPGIRHFAYPQTRAGLGLRGVADKLMTSAPLRPVLNKLTDVADTDRELPSLQQK